MSLTASAFRKLSGIAWLLVLAGSIGYITRYSLSREDRLYADVQDVVAHAESMLAEERAVESPTVDEQVAAQAHAIAEVATMKIHR